LNDARVQAPQMGIEPIQRSQRTHLGKRASLHRLIDTMPGASETRSSPHLAQLFPRTSPVGAFAKQIRAPRSSRYR